MEKMSGYIPQEDVMDGKYAPEKMLKLSVFMIL
jgi:hypothetical protein